MSMDEMSNKPKRPFGRSLKDFEPLSEPEKKLIDCAARGEVCGLGESAPEEPTPENIIRPELIRFLALGGDDNAPVHEKGIQLIGAYIGEVNSQEHMGTLDLEGARLTSRLALCACRFAIPLDLCGSTGVAIYLNESILPSLIADGLKLSGDLCLRKSKFTSDVSLTGVNIEGDIDCSGGNFISLNEFSINLERAEIGGGVFLCDGFRSAGSVLLDGIRIGDNLYCKGGKFEKKRIFALTLESESKLTI